MNPLPLPALLLASGLTLSAPVHTPFVDDDKIFHAVEGDLRGAGSLAGTDITVAARQGVVTLTGAARTLEQIMTAGRIAARTRGVTGVTNDIRIRSAR